MVNPLAKAGSMDLPKMVFHGRKAVKVIRGEGEKSNAKE